jgi:hypothetical protein
LFFSFWSFLSCLLIQVHPSHSAVIPIVRNSKPFRLIRARGWVAACETIRLTASIGSSTPGARTPTRSWPTRWA